MNFYELYDIARQRLNPKKLNEHAKVGDAVCALESMEGNVYCGLSLVATCGLGYCAEQSTIMEMINAGETSIKVLLVLDKFDNILPPCGKCLELITQIDERNEEAVVYVGEEEHLLVKELYPRDWKKTRSIGIRKKDAQAKDKYNLQRFLDAQKSVYSNVIKELTNGCKESHWMWFVFPQLRGLGQSEMSNYYGISGIEEAKAYFDNPILKNRYLECCNILLKSDKSSLQIFGSMDDRKLLSSLTLFFEATHDRLIQEVKSKFFGDAVCPLTIGFLNEAKT